MKNEHLKNVSKLIIFFLQMHYYIPSNLFTFILLSLIIIGQCPTFDEHDLIRKQIMYAVNKANCSTVCLLSIF